MTSRRKKSKKGVGLMGEVARLVVSGTTRAAAEVHISYCRRQGVFLV